MCLIEAFAIRLQKYTNLLHKAFVFRQQKRTSMGVVIENLLFVWQITVSP